MNKDLKPCPFCGRTNTLTTRYGYDKDGTDSYFFQIGCLFCGIRMTAHAGEFDTKFSDIEDIIEKLIEKWNRRAENE